MIAMHLIRGGGGGSSITAYLRGREDSDPFNGTPFEDSFLEYSIEAIRNLFNRGSSTSLFGASSATNPSDASIQNWIQSFE